MKKTFLLLFLTLLFISCSDCVNLYRADVTIENVDNPGEYRLTVEFDSDDYVKRIYFPKGGYLDRSHFNKKDMKFEWTDVGEYIYFTDDRDRDFIVNLYGRESIPCRLQNDSFVYE